MLPHMLLKYVLPAARQIEIAGRHRPARVDFHGPAAHKDRRTVAGRVHPRADMREETKRRFEFGTIGGLARHACEVSRR